MKKKIICIFILTIIVNLLLYVTVIKKPKVSEQSIGVDLKNLTGEINKLNTIEQRFNPAASQVATLEIFFSTYNRKNDGLTNVKINDENGNEVCTYSIENATVKDNEYKLIDVSGVNLNIKEKYTLVISSELEEGGITAWIDTSNQLVAKIGYREIFNLFDFIQVNIVFLLINIGFINLVDYLRK